MASFCVFVLWFCDPSRVLFERGFCYWREGVVRSVSEAGVLLLSSPLGEG